MPSHVSSTIDGERGKITIDRPDRLNALGSRTFEEVIAQLKSAADAGVTTLVVESTGDRAFCAGADLQEIDGMSETEFCAYQRLARRAFDAIDDHSAIVVAAVDGLAHGAGCELVLAADMAVTTEQGEFALPEVKLGLTPGNGGTQRLLQTVGERKAIEMLTTGAPVPAPEAERLGLVNRVASERELEEVTDELVSQILSNAPLAVQSAKRLVTDGRDASLSTALSYEQEVTTRLYTTDDAREGINSFIEGTTPSFNGQ